jgi:phosphoenolpyruvate---glycerone phosphotransferase subunit DhaL
MLKKRRQVEDMHLPPFDDSQSLEGQAEMTISRDQFIDWVKAFAGVIAENKEYLTGLDSAIGDGDHGINMDRGFQAVLTKLPAFANQDIGSIAKNIGMVLISTVGGASGPLYGTLFMQIGKETAGKLELTLNDWTAAIDSAVNGVMMRGKANLGDKTMLDTLIPALNTLKECTADGTSLTEALKASEKTAEQGMLSTIPLVAKKGRASYLGERSAGTQDPGATSSYFLLKTAVHALSSSA